MDPRLGTTALVLTIEALLGFNVRNFTCILSFYREVYTNFDESGYIIQLMLSAFRGKAPGPHWGFTAPPDPSWMLCTPHHYNPWLRRINAEVFPAPLIRNNILVLRAYRGVIHANISHDERGTRR